MRKMVSLMLRDLTANIWYIVLHSTYYIKKQNLFRLLLLKINMATQGHKTWLLRYENIYLMNL